MTRRDAAASRLRAQCLRRVCFEDVCNDEVHLSRLVRFSQQIVYGLDGIEGFEGDFHEDRIPKSHTAIP